MHTWFQLAVGALQVSILAQVFAIGLRTTWPEATYLFRHQRLLWKSILARNVAMPIIAILLIKVFSFHFAIAITLGVLAVTPVPPLLPRSQIKMGAHSEYVLGLLVSQAVLAVVCVPITIQIMNQVLGSEAHFSAREVAVVIVETILAPLAAGMFMARIMPAFQHIAQLLLTVGTVLLIAGAIPLLVLAWKTFGALSGNGAMLALAIFVIAGTLVGHLLGGPSEQDRTTLAEATSSAHPGVAMAIAVANFPDQKLLVAGALVIYLIIRAIVSAPYMRRRRVGPRAKQLQPSG